MADVITLAQTKEFLNITTTDYDSELPFYISAAQQLWVNRGGPVGEPASSVDEWYDGGSDTIVVRNTPIVSVESVVETFGAIGYTLLNTPAGTSGYAWAYTVDLATGTFIRRAAGIAVPFISGVRNVHIQYTPGYSTAPEIVQQAVLLLVSHMWETQRGIGQRPGLGGNEYDPRYGFTWPRRAEEILDGLVVPGIA